MKINSLNYHTGPDPASRGSPEGLIFRRYSIRSYKDYQDNNKTLK
jgi:hypothetical protein